MGGAAEKQKGESVGCRPFYKQATQDSEEPIY
jgi:hypothetical protein